MDKHNPPGAIKRMGKLYCQFPIAFSILILVLIFGSFKLFDYASARYACHSRWVDSSIQSQYTLRGGCLVKYQDTWIPEGNFRIN